MKYSAFFSFICGTLWAAHALAGGYNVSGKIIKPDGTPFSGTAVPFTVELVNTTGSCVIYKENFSVNMSDTKGAFHVVFGGPAASRAYPTSGTLTAELALSNANGTNFTCADNSVYTPGTSDERSIRISFNDGNSWQVFSQQALKSVPSATSAKYATTADSALSANAVATFQATNILRSSSSTLPDLSAAGAANFQTLLTRFSDIQNLIDGNSSTYLKNAPAETDPSVKTFAKTSLPNCAAGYVLTGDGTNLSCVADLGGGGGSLPAGTAGQFLKYDTGNWISAGVNITDVTGLSSSLTSLNSGKLDKSSIPICNFPNHLEFSSPSNAFSCAMMTASGDVTGDLNDTKVQKIQGRAVAATAPANGQVLKFNGSAWEPATISGAGTVTSVAAGTGLTGGPITSSGTLSLTNTGVTATTYGSVSSIPSFTVDAQGRITNATTNSIVFPVTTVAGRGGAVVIRPSDIQSGSADYFGYKPNNVACATGETLLWNATRWECGTPPALVTGSAGGDLGSNYPSPTVVKIQGRAVSSNLPVEGQTLVYKSGVWTPAQLGCPSGWNAADRGAPFCYRNASSNTYPAGLGFCASVQGDICSMNQLRHLKAQLGGAMTGSYYTDQMGYSVSSSVVPIVWSTSGDVGFLSSTESDMYNVYCCRQQTY